MQERIFDHFARYFALLSMTLNEMIIESFALAKQRLELDFFEEFR